jgi:N-acetylneuraminate synthase
VKKTVKLPLLIAEVANCHGGSKSYMSELVGKLCRISVDAIKFQFIIAEELLSPSHPDYALFKSLEFYYPFWQRITSKVKDSGKKLIFDIFGYDSLRKAINLDADMLKIHTSDFDNLAFIKQVVSYNKPVFLSTGGATLCEIDSVMNICKGKIVCLMVGFQAFPTPIEESHLNRIEFLQERYNCAVGYMDHSSAKNEFSKIISCIGIGKGAVAIEKHVYLKRRKKTYDWQSALDVGEMDNFRELLVNSMMSCGEKNLIPTSLEKRYFENKRKCAVASKTLLSNQRLKVSDVVFLWGNNSKYDTMVSRASIHKFIGRLTRRKIEADAPITREMFK